MSRRLAAIVSTDVVGYSKLMQNDELRTLNELNLHRHDIVQPLLSTHNGRIVKLIGDGSLLEFASVVDAVAFSLDFQSAVRISNEDKPECERLVYRVGVNLGDVIAEGDDIFGDGVNIAARLESLAEPGGLMISASAYEQVKNKVAEEFEHIGQRNLKNIAEPVTVYRACIGEKSRFANGTDGLSGSHLHGRMAARASIVVLPFEDYSEGSVLRHFAEGMTEDLITELARWPEIRVTARNTAMLYKDSHKDACTISQELQVNYLLEGSVRHSGARLRITAQLIDGRTGGHVWADRFDENGDDVLALQDRVIRLIVEAITGNRGVIREDEYAKTWARADVEMEEYDYYLRGHELFYRFTREDNEKALRIWDEGLAKYPNSGLLKVKVGWSLMAAAMYGWRDDREALFARIHDLVEDGLADPAIPPAGHRFGLWLKTTIANYVGHHDLCLQTAREAARAYPFDSEGLFIISDDVMFAGDLELASHFVDQALDLDLRPAPFISSFAGAVRFGEERYAEAVRLLTNARPVPETLWYLTACYSALDEPRKAQRSMKQLVTVCPKFTLEYCRYYRPWRETEISNRLCSLVNDVQLHKSEI